MLQIVNDDMPFLVDSVSMALAEMGVGVHVLGHPLVRFTRDRAGKVTAVGEGKHESLMLLEIDRLPPEEMAQVEKRIRSVLDEVRAIVRDWSAMREKMLALADDMATRRMPADDEGRREAQEFLRWAAADHFTFFGYREYRVEKGTGILAAVEDSGLGLLREDIALGAVEKGEVVLWPHGRIESRLSFIYRLSAEHDPAIVGMLSVLREQWGV